MENCPNCYKKKPRDEKLVKTLKTRINRLTGQLNGVSKMIDENRYCSDILIQISAIESALKEVGFIIFNEHMKSCVADDIKVDDYSSLDEAIELAKKIL